MNTRTEYAAVDVFFVVQIMPNFYLFRDLRVSKRSIRRNYHHEIDLRKEKLVSDVFVIVWPACNCVNKLCMVCVVWLV